MESFESAGIYRHVFFDNSNESSLISQNSLKLTEVSISVAKDPETQADIMDVKVNSDGKLIVSSVEVTMNP